MGDGIKCVIYHITLSPNHITLTLSLLWVWWCGLDGMSLVIDVINGDDVDVMIGVRLLWCYTLQGVRWWWVWWCWYHPLNNNQQTQTQTQSPSLMIQTPSHNNNDDGVWMMDGVMISPNEWRWWWDMGEGEWWDGCDLMWYVDVDMIPNHHPSLLCDGWWWMMGDGVIECGFVIGDVYSISIHHQSHSKSLQIPNSHHIIPHDPNSMDIIL